MDTPSTLAEIIDVAAQRHDGASGRRLAELAQHAGFTLSHATVNRLRRGDIGKVNRATIEALAHLANVDAEVVLRAAGSGDRSPEAIAAEYVRLAADSLRLAVEYAQAKGIDTTSARDELDRIAGAAHGTRGAPASGTPRETHQDEKTGSRIVRVVRASDNDDTSIKRDGLNDTESSPETELLESAPRQSDYDAVARTRRPGIPAGDQGAYDNTIGEEPDPEGPEGGA